MNADFRPQVVRLFAEVCGIAESSITDKTRLNCDPVKLACRLMDEMRIPFLTDSFDDVKTFGDVMELPNPLPFPNENLRPSNSTAIPCS